MTTSRPSFHKTPGESAIHLEVTMDPLEFRAFNFNFTYSDCEEQPKPARTNLHVKWASLPKPDHRTGSIVYTSLSELDSTNSNRSAYNTNARRRSTNSNAAREQESPFGPSYGKRRHSTNSIPKFQEVRWLEDPHPGKRIPVDVYEGESISPKSSTVFVPLWCTDMEAKMFRARVQPSRVTGKRRPGMTARSVRPARSAKRDTDRHDDGCLVQ